MFLVRLFIGLLKGLVLGGLVGYGLVNVGLAVPGAVVAYLAAAACGVGVALVAGKPIWAKDARIEVGMKAVVGALLAPALLFAVRRFLNIELPIDIAALPGFESLQGTQLTLGSFAVTSLAMVTAILAAFYDADNQPVEADQAKGGKRIAAGGSRVAVGGAQAAEEEIEPSAQTKERTL